jgi:hypothetical protein
MNLQGYSGVIIALIGVVVGFVGTLMAGAISSTSSLVSTAITTVGPGCIQYESWVIDRIHEGMTDENIGTLTMLAIRAATNTQNTTAYPTEPSASSYVTPVETHYYAPCGAESSTQVASRIQTIRAAVPPH